MNQFTPQKEARIDPWDYKKHLKTLHAINELTIDGTPLRDSFSIDGWNAWQWYQGILFETLKWQTLVGKTPSARFLSLRSFVYHFLMSCGLFWLSVLEYARARFRKPGILVYSIDLMTSRWGSDQRIAPLYEALNKSLTPFVECFHEVSAWKALRHFISRRRLSSYLEAPDAWFALGSIFTSPKELALLERIDFSSIPKEDREFVRYIVGNALERLSLSRFRIRKFRTYLKKCGIKKIFLIDDPRHIWELLAAAKHEGIETVLVQHGHYTKYHVGFLRFSESRFPYLSPDTVIVWSDYWKNELMRHGSIFTKIVVGGYKDPLPATLPPHSVGETLRVFVPYESVAPKEEVARYLEVLRADPGVRLIFKPRSETPVEEQLAEYHLSEGDVEILRKFPKNLFDVFDVAIGTYTTLLSELVMQGVPVAVLETSMDYGDGLIENGVADRLMLEPKNTLFERIRTLASIDEETIAARRAKITTGTEGPMKVAILQEIKK